MPSDRKCRKCGNCIPNRTLINGVQKNLCNRKYCLECSPWGQHNTKKDIDHIGRPAFYSEWSQENKIKNMESLKKRGRERKLKLIEFAGGGCSICKYNNSISALHFHHRDAKNKNFGLSQNNLWSKKWEDILLEFSKCDLLCSNCHAEVEDKRRKPE